MTMPTATEAAIRAAAARSNPPTEQSQVSADLLAIIGHKIQFATSLGQNRCDCNLISSEHIARQVVAILESPPLRYAVQLDAINDEHYLIQITWPDSNTHATD
jgi:hypothetical protein